MLTAVYFTENATKVPSSPASLPFSLSSAVPLLLPQSFVLEAKVKKEKMGRRKTDGWATKVLRIALCQQANRLVRKPGRKVVSK